VTFIFLVGGAAAGISAVSASLISDNEKGAWLWLWLCLQKYLCASCVNRLLWPISRTVQGQPRSKFMVRTDNAWVVSYSTSIDHIIVSLTVCEIFDVRWPMTHVSHPKSDPYDPLNHRPIDPLLASDSNPALLRSIKTINVDPGWP